METIGRRIEAGHPRAARATRSRISLAALLVKVTARTAEGGTRRCVMMCAMRCVMTRVLPLPAPARISSGPSVCVTASRCCAIQAFEEIHEESTEFNTQATLTLCIGDLPNRFCEPRATYSQPPRPRPVRKFQYTGKPKL